MEQMFRRTAQQVLEQFGVTKDGLTQAQVEKQRQTYGENALTEEKKKSPIVVFLEQFKDLLVIILIIAAIISAISGNGESTIVIVAVITLNAILGTVQHFKAEKSLESLKALSSPNAKVMRDGRKIEVSSKEIVPGDILMLEAGDLVVADGRIIENYSLQVNESSLTGESEGVDKISDVIDAENVALGDQKNMVFSGSLVTYGRASVVVTATGMKTEIGKIATLMNQTQQKKTPLQESMDNFSQKLAIAIIGICIVVFGLSLYRQMPILDSLMFAVALAVAAIPEGLPAVVTIVLALGVARMAKANTIIRKLPAVETLGAVSVVCSDKTGTLTENKMKVLKLYAEDKTLSVSQVRPREFSRLMQGFLLCNNAVIGKTELGDSTELALLSMGEQMGISRERLEERYPRLEEIPFDSDKKYMGTLQKDQSQVCAYIKGACDYLLEVGSFWWIGGKIEPLGQIQKMKIRRVMEGMAEEGLRVLALAFKEHVSDWNESSIMKNLVFAGLAGMMDAPRKQVNQSVYQLKRAGVQVVMITGDYQETAFSIAKMTGIARKREQCVTGEELDAMSDAEFSSKMNDIRVFARVTPAHKVKIVKEFKKNGKIVAMTGDGVNDAPSLHAADIGIAMGANGTDVAKNAADLILADDNFSTIEKAVEEGRSIYVNIKKSILFLLSSNFGEIMTMFVSIAFSMPSPLKASHILWVNLITDSLPALALGVDKNDTGLLMAKKPRDEKESLFAHGGWLLTIGYGLLIGAITLYAFLTGGQTYAFTVLGISQLFHAIGMRDCEKSIFQMNHLENPVMIFSFFTGLALQVAVTEIPWLVEAFQTRRLLMGEWLWLLGISAVPLAVHEIVVLIKRLKKG